MAGSIVLADVGSREPRKPEIKISPPPHLIFDFKINSPFLRIKEASVYLNISIWKVRNLIQSGKLSYFQECDNAIILIDIEDLNAFIERNKCRERLPS